MPSENQSKQTPPNWQPVKAGRPPGSKNRVAGPQLIAARKRRRVILDRTKLALDKITAFAAGADMRDLAHLPVQVGGPPPKKSPAVKSKGKIAATALDEVAVEIAIDDASPHAAPGLDSAVCGLDAKGGPCVREARHRGHHVAYKPPKVLTERSMYKCSACHKPGHRAGGKKCPEYTPIPIRPEVFAQARETIRGVTGPIPFAKTARAAPARSSSAASRSL